MTGVKDVKKEARASSKKRDVKAVIDIGSNSIKLRVLRKEKNALRPLADATEAVRLAKGLESGFLDEYAMRHGVNVVEKWVKRAEELESGEIRVVGTMAMRSAQNAETFVEWVRERTGLTAEILSGEEEARLAWLGAIHGLTAGMGLALGPSQELQEGNSAVFDMGGASTEFIIGSGLRIERTKSFPVGAVSLTERFFTNDPVRPGSVDAALKYLRTLFSEGGFFEELPAIDSVIGLGGGLVAMASVRLALQVMNPDKINGTLLTWNEVHLQMERYAVATLAGRMKITGVPPKRADIILAGACIALCALDLLNASSFRVSINGLRHGLLVEMFDAKKTR